MDVGTAGRRQRGRRLPHFLVCLSLTHRILPPCLDRVQFTRSVSERIVSMVHDARIKFNFRINRRPIAEHTDEPWETTSAVLWRCGGIAKEREGYTRKARNRDKLLQPPPCGAAFTSCVPTRTKATAVGKEPLRQATAKFYKSFLNSREGRFYLWGGGGVRYHHYYLK